MASTYSTNLAIELIGTGDQAGAWGNTTNTNLGTLIEQAISGYVTQAVVTGTDTSITIPNGATGVARNMYIELTGTGGTNTNLLVPANKKLYFIYNNSTGAVTVKVAGQTGISVAAAQKKILVCNGTDIVEATTYLQASGGSATLTTLTATSASITNLSVSSLTVSSLSLSNATFTSATITTLKSTSATIDNLASTSANITTLTGTNFSAASLTLTNALKVAQGGTGVTGTPSNGQLLIGNGTGFNLNTLNGGPGVGITNQSGAITITATGTGFIASVSATSPLQSVGTESITISIASSTGSGAVVLASGAQFSATSANITTLTGTTLGTFTSGTVTNLNSTSANITTLTGTTFGTTATTQLRGASAAITNISATSLTVTNTIQGSISGNAATATNGVVTTGSYANPSWITSLATSKLSGTVAVANGGTALSSTPTNGQLLIGNGTGYTLAALTAGSGVTITNGAGAITVAAAGLPTMNVVTGTTQTATAGNQYVLTNVAATTVTLPASPSAGDTVYVTVANSLTTNVVARNGNKIMSLSEDLTLNAPYAAAQLRYADATRGWVLT
jgi:hypothetical protein